MIVKERLAIIVEQGGFRKGWGCRNQTLTLMVVGQVQMAMRKNGMMVAFIDLKRMILWTGKHAGLSGALGTERSAGSLPGRTVQWGGG